MYFIVNVRSLSPMKLFLFVKSRVGDFILIKGPVPAHVGTDYHLSSVFLSLSVFIDLF